MNYGVIRAIGAFRAPCGNVFRLLVLANNADFKYIYTFATNYCFRTNDIVSWDNSALWWHAATRSIKFELLQTEVAHKIYE